MAKYSQRLVLLTIIVWVLYAPTQASEYNHLVVFQATTIFPTYTSDIYYVASDGENLTRLTSVGNAYQPTWSPDGTHIAFSIESEDNRNNSSITLLSIEDGEITEIISTQDLAFGALEPLGISQPQWSPDGHHILFVVTYQAKNCDQARSSDLYTIEITSGLISRLTKDCALKSNPAWSPSGEKILFLSNEDNDHEFYEYAIHVINRAGDNRQRIPNEFPSDPVSPQWIDEDGRIIFMGRVMGWGIFVINTDTMETTLFSDYSPDFEHISSFDISSDMQHVVFSACDGNQCREEIYVLDLETEIVSQLTDNDVADVFPSWQPFRLSND